MELQVDAHSVYAYTGTRELNPELPTVVFVHGSGLDHSAWILQSRYFAHHGHNVLAVDLPGHGRSQGEPLSGIEAMADWIPRLLDAARVKTAAVVGHSMGALVTLEVAARHPERIRSVALLGISVPMPVADPLLDAAKANNHAAIDMITIWGHGHGAQLGGNPMPGMWMTGGALRLLERAKPGVLYNDLKSCNDYCHGLESAARVRCSVLLIQGRRDLMTPPRAARELLAAIPDARSVVLQDCGHMMCSEKPDGVLDALVEFL